MSKSCSCKKRVISNAVLNGSGNNDCNDVCVNPQCGDPKYLTVLTPVIYDEIGINICRTFEIPSELLTNYPTAVYASVEVIDITFSTTCEDAVTITQIPTRPNCYEVTLTNLNVTFAVRLYDCCMRLLTTATVCEILYLPPNVCDESYDEDTNPTSVSLEIFAPYGVSYVNGNIEEPDLNFIGFSTTNNSLVQGLNLMAIPKVLNFDISDGTLTVGVTLVVSSVYFTPYQLPHNGKAVISKGDLETEDESVCMDFVEGSLLDRNIKPLELCNPGDNKEPCDECEGPNHCDCENDCPCDNPCDDPCNN